MTGCMRLSEFFIFSTMPQMYIGRTKTTFTSVEWKKKQSSKKIEVLKYVPKTELCSENVCSFFNATIHVAPKILYAELCIL